MSCDDPHASRIRYAHRGVGPPIVLLHGIGSRKEVFAPIVGELAKTRSVYSIDLPGFGESPMQTDVPADIDGYASIVADLIRTLGLSEPHVAGSSMGAAVALELGRSGVAGRVTAFAPVGFWTAGERRWCQYSISAVRVFARLFRPLVDFLARFAIGRTALFGLFFGRPWKVTADHAIADVSALIDAAGFRAARNGFAHYDLLRNRRQSGSLDDIPVTVAWGNLDAVLPPRRQARAARELLPSARHIRLPGCGHLPFSDDPTRCVAILLAPVGGSTSTSNALLMEKESND
ncbi:MAG: alpha/beta fold hydrolase [Rhodococcus sp. (in: high G+C Gram-positive bacteria)]|uniref:alpha/beta fold hydrolase n=1 Tax=Rhodococcus sp. TaxID=1831 RepID=UPI002ADABE50|nr:alpha/beta fold hydrolase [Rhodococcus sp. (in: high G+C Gram-positive bacteria)]